MFQSTVLNWDQDFKVGLYTRVGLQLSILKWGRGGGVQRRGISVGIRLGVKSVVEAFQRQVNKSSHRKPVIALNDGGG